MRNPRLGESNMGALAGAVVAAISGLFALGIAPAILARNPALLFATPILNFLSFVICGISGWVVGGQIGPRVGEPLNSRTAEIIAGATGGLVPGILLVLWGWHMVTRP
jgi:hypothetical protein